MYLNTVGQASENLGKLSMFQWLCSVPVFMPGCTEQLGMGCLDNEGLLFSSQDSGSLGYLIISVNCIFKKCHQDICKKNVWVSWLFLWFLYIRKHAWKTKPSCFSIGGKKVPWGEVTFLQAVMEPARPPAALLLFCCGSKTSCISDNSTLLCVPNAKEREHSPVSHLFT